MNQQIFVTHHDRTVHGIYTQPAGDGPFPAVLFSHGYNGCMTDYLAASEMLAQKGIACVCYTFCGGSTRDTSGFPSTSMTLFTERDDLLAMLDWMRLQPAIDPKRITLFGSSMGGLVTVLAAHERPADMERIALQFPALCIADNWRERFPCISDIPEVVDFWNLPLGRHFFTSMRELDAMSLLPDISQPVLIIHGDQDPTVPLVYSEKAERIMPHAMLQVFYGEGHGFTPEGERQAMKLLSLFVISGEAKIEVSSEHT
ncbi:MAG: alpha/beta fold hydrolase [Clostridia bacterium]|nr:alpha/beta fold hydrolase [Clostridia bacterium]